MLIRRIHGDEMTLTYCHKHHMWWITDCPQCCLDSADAEYKQKIADLEAEIERLQLRESNANDIERH